MLVATTHIGVLILNLQHCSAPPPPSAPVANPAMTEDEREEYEEKVIKKWKPSQPVPDGYAPVKAFRLRLAIGGISTFTGLWVINLAFALRLDGGDPKWAPLAAPIVGPLITIGTSHSGSAGTVLLVIDSVAQAAGAALAIAGFAAPKLELRPIQSKVSLVPFPYIPNEHTAGAGLTATF